MATGGRKEYAGPMGADMKLRSSVDIIHMPKYFIRIYDSEMTPLVGKNGS